LSYDPPTGRFTQEVPIGFAGGFNLYGFANGDPVNFSDPFGLCPIPQLCLAALGAGAGVVLNGAMNMAMDRPFLGELADGRDWWGNCGSHGRSRGGA
jgi:hypothetical protein